MGYVTWLRASDNLPGTCLNVGKTVGPGLGPPLRVGQQEGGTSPGSAGSRG